MGKKVIEHKKYEFSFSPQILSETSRSKKKLARRIITVYWLSRKVDVVVVVVCFGGGAYQHCSHEGLFYSSP